MNGIGLAFKGAKKKRAVLIGDNGAPFSPEYLEVDPGVVGGSMSQERIDRGWADFHRALMPVLWHG